MSFTTGRTNRQHHHQDQHHPSTHLPIHPTPVYPPPPHSTHSTNQINWLLACSFACEWPDGCTDRQTYGHMDGRTASIHIVHTHICTHAHTYTHTISYTFIRMCIHTHMYTYTTTPNSTQHRALSGTTERAHITNTITEPRLHRHTLAPRV